MADEGSLGARIDTHRFKVWLFLRVDRSMLTTVIGVGFFVGLVVISMVGPAAMRGVILDADALWWVFSPMITGIITAVSLVVTVNQLVLSQELGALSDQREGMDGAMDFRADVEPWLSDHVAPTDPAAFIASLLEAIEEKAAPLQGCADEIDEFAEDVIEDARTSSRRLEDAEFGTFDVVSAALEFNYGSKINEARGLASRHEDQPDTARRLEELSTLLSFYGPTREHIKTLYFQWELVNLSRAMLGTAFPALLAALAMLLVVDGGSMAFTLAGIDALAILVAAAVAISLAPFFVLCAYVLRIATVAKRTLAIGPFVLRSDD